MASRSGGAERQCSVVVFDVETTGLSAHCRLVEFAAVVIDPAGEVVERYETMIDPGSPPGPTWLHGLDSGMLGRAPKFGAVAGDIQRLFRDRVPVAHRLDFDWAVLRRAFEPLGVSMPVAPAGVCTAALATRHLGTRSSLSALCRRLGIEHAGPHRAGPDAEATAAVYLALLASGARAHGRPLSPFAGSWRLERSASPVPRPKAIEPASAGTART